MISLSVICQCLIVFEVVVSLSVAVDVVDLLKIVNCHQCSPCREKGAVKSGGESFVGSTSYRILSGFTCLF